MTTRDLCLVLLGLSGAACRQSKPRVVHYEPTGPLTVANAGFATPESVLHDPESDLYFVSNINGSPLDADDNGFISIVSPLGQVTALKGIDGAADSIRLDAPKGMAVAGDLLFVADITTIRRFDRRTGGPRGEYPVPGATFLNDIVAGADGSIYFTDSGLKAGASGFAPSGSDAVYRLSPAGKLDTLARGEELGHPNGIALSGDSVWVVSFGSGELYRVAGGKKLDAIKLPKGGLDGLVIVNGEAFISSWDAEAVFRGPLAGPFDLQLTKLPAPADLGRDVWRHRLLIPLFNNNEIRIVPLAP